MSEIGELDEHLVALRAAADDGDDPRAALATRLRLRRSLEAGHRIRRQLFSAGAAIAILLVGTASWALVTGNLPRLWPAAHHDEPAVAPPDLRPRAAPAPPAVVERALPAPLTGPPAPIEPLTTAPAPAHHPAAAPRPAAPTPVETLYRRAHELHFRGSDHAAALAAWDAYLAAEPAGRFAVEARYNRALCLIRLGRLAEAKAALLPFANHEVEPAGYRQDEARELVDRIGLNE